MARVIDPTSFKDRGYTYQQPTPKEAREMGWKNGFIPFDSRVAPEDLVRTWLRENVWWQDYIIDSYGRVYFKHERDLMWYNLKWM